MSRVNLPETSLERQIRTCPGRHFKTSPKCQIGTSPGWLNVIFRERPGDIGEGTSLRRPGVQYLTAGNTSRLLLLKCNKTKRLPLLTAFSSLSDINTTLKICISIIWSFTLRYVIATTSLWLLKKISYNDVTSISVGNWSISQCKYNQQKTNVATVSGAHWDGLVY